MKQSCLNFGIIIKGVVHICMTSMQGSTLLSEQRGMHETSVVVDVNNLKNCRKPVKLQKESPAGCAEEGNQSKGI